MFMYTHQYLQYEGLKRMWMQTCMWTYEAYANTSSYAISALMQLFQKEAEYIW